MGKLDTAEERNSEADNIATETLQNKTQRY